MSAFEKARKNMVECQVMPNKVTDERILNAMLKIPREEFVPKSEQSHAYLDEDICLGGNRFLEEPVILARMIEIAKLQEDDLVLDIGSTTGYSSAILSEIVATVVSVEKDKKLLELSEQKLRELDICNVAIMESELINGYQEQAPYDVIFIHGAVSIIPKEILNQLAENGRLVAVLVSQDNLDRNTGLGRIVLVEKEEKDFKYTDICDVSTPVLEGFSENKKFVF